MIKRTVILIILLIVFSGCNKHILKRQGPLYNQELLNSKYMKKVGHSPQWYKRQQIKYKYHKINNK